MSAWAKEHIVPYSCVYMVSLLQGTSLLKPSFSTIPLQLAILIKLCQRQDCDAQWFGTTMFLWLKKRGGYFSLSLSVQVWNDESGGVFCLFRTGFQLFSAPASTLFRWQRGVSSASCLCSSCLFSTCAPSMLMRRQEGTGASSLSCIDKIRQMNNPRRYILSAISPEAEAHLLPAWSSPKPHCLATRPGLWCACQTMWCSTYVVVMQLWGLEMQPTAGPHLCLTAHVGEKKNLKIISSGCFGQVGWMCFDINSKNFCFLDALLITQLLEQCSNPCKITTIGGNGWFAVKHAEVGYIVQMGNTNGFYWVKAVLFSSFDL